MNLQQTDRQTTVQLQQLKVSHVIGNVKCWIGPLLRNGRVYRLLTGQTRVNSGKQAPAKKVPLSDISITVQFNLKNNCLMSHSHLMQYWILTFLYLLYSQVFGNTKEGNVLNMNSLPIVTVFGPMTEARPVERRKQRGLQHQHQHQHQRGFQALLIMHHLLYLYLLYLYLLYLLHLLLIEPKQDWQRKRDHPASHQVWQRSRLMSPRRLLYHQRLTH